MPALMLAERPSPLCFVMKGSSLPSFFFSSAEFCFSCWLFVLVRRSPRPPTPPATTHVRPGSYRDPPSPCPTLSPNGTCACGRARGCTERWESSAEFPKRSTSSSGFFFFSPRGHATRTQSLSLLDLRQWQCPVQDTRRSRHTRTHRVTGGLVVSVPAKAALLRVSGRRTAFTNARKHSVNFTAPPPGTPPPTSRCKHGNNDKPVQA